MISFKVIQILKYPTQIKKSWKNMTVVVVFYTFKEGLKEDIPTVRFL